MLDPGANPESDPEPDPEPKCIYGSGSAKFRLRFQNTAAKFNSWFPGSW